MNSEDSRNIILAIVLSVLVLIGWQYFYAGPQLQKERQAQTQTQSQPQANLATPTAGGAGAVAPPGAAPATPSATQSNQGQVWVLRDGKPVAVAVVLGLDDDTYTEIVSGNVQPGDLVITGEQSTTGGQTATPQLRL